MKRDVARRGGSAIVGAVTVVMVVALGYLVASGTAPRGTGGGASQVAAASASASASETETAPASATVVATPPAESPSVESPSVSATETPAPSADPSAPSPSPSAVPTSPAPTDSPAGTVAFPDVVPTEALDLLSNTFLTTPAFPGPDGQLDYGQTRYGLIGPGRTTVALDIPTETSDVTTDWGRPIATAVEGDEIVISSVDVATGRLTVLHRLKDPRGGIGHLTATIDRAGTTLYLTGAGIRAIDIASGSERLIVPGPPDEARNDPRWSPSGQTLISSVCGMETCDVDVVDAASGTARGIEDFVALATTDRLVLGYDGVDRRWKTVDLETGIRRPIAEKLIPVSFNGYTYDDTHAMIWGRGDDGRINVARADLSTGEVELVYQYKGNSLANLHTNTRSGDFLLVSEDVEAADQAASGFSFDLLDLRSGTLLRNAVPVLPAP